MMLKKNFFFLSPSTEPFFYGFQTFVSTENIIKNTNKNNQLHFFYTKKHHLLNVLSFKKESFKISSSLHQEFLFKKFSKHGRYLNGISDQL